MLFYQTQPEKLKLKKKQETD